MITKVWNRKHLLIVSKLRCAHQHSAICHPLGILIWNTCQHAHVSTYKNVCVGTFTFDMIIYVEEVRGNCFQNGTKGQLGKSESKQPQNKHTHTPPRTLNASQERVFFFFFPLKSSFLNEVSSTSISVLYHPLQAFYCQDTECQHHLPSRYLLPGYT